MMPRSIPLVALAGLLLAGASAQAEDWPEFRGPTGQGHAQGELPVEWGPTHNVVWKKEVPGAGWSSPAIAAGKVYLTSAVAVPGSKDLSLTALCLDARDGSTVWSKEVFRQDGAGAPRIHSKNSHASPTPLVAGDRLFVHFGHQGTACLDLHGKVLWTYRKPYAPVHGNGASPVLTDGLLVFSTDGASVRELVALDVATGEVRWKTKRTGTAVKNFSFHTPLVIEVGNRKQIVSVGSSMVGGYDVQTGKEVWRVRHGGYSVIPRPVYGHGLVFISTGYDAPVLLAIRPDGTGDVTDTHVAWTTKRHAPHTPSPLLLGDELYMVSDAGFASCLDARTGKVHWSKRLAGNGYSSSLLAAGGRIYCQSENGIGTVLEAGKAFKQLARNDLGERTLASAAACGGALFLRTAKHLYRIGK
jgi:outer membrane protein assembly factor BamB